MSKKTSILIILGIIIVIIGGLIFFYFSSSNKTENITGPTTTSNPFGNNTTNTVSTTTTIHTNNGMPSAGDQKSLAALTQIYRNPTSGSVFFINKDNQNTLRFVDRAVGNIYEYIQNSQSGEVQRITNTTIPKTQEAVWSNLGNNLILRYLDNATDNISSFSAKINISTSSIDTTPGNLSGVFLSSNIKQLVISPKGDRVFGLVDKSDKSGTYGFIENLDGSGKKIIFDSQISYWNIAWPKDNIITFTTKPNYKDSGLLYFFNPQTYSFDRIIGDITGMSTLVNKDASLVAYSYSINNIINLDVYDVKNRINNNLKLPTLSDKCVWGNINSKILYCAIPQNINTDNYPDVWYQGVESFNDNIWKIDTETGDIKLLYMIGSNEVNNIDAFNLVISADDQYIAFMNKNDLSLWLLQIK